MKLNRFSSCVTAAAVSGLLACGGAPTSQAQPRAVTTSATQLMSAQVPGPAPKVGKSHLAVDEDLDVSPAPDTNAESIGDAKDGRRSDGSRRGGRFGASK